MKIYNQIDVNLFNEIGKEFHKRFHDENITKIVTIEASGIGIACITAQYFNVPVVFAKKAMSKNLDDDLFESKVCSYTKGVDCTIRISKKYIRKSDKILIIDDFLANGNAILGLKEIIDEAGAELVGAGIVIEKGFQKGGTLLRNMGIRVESLAIIDSMENGKIIFR